MSIIIPYIIHNDNEALMSELRKELNIDKDEFHDISLVPAISRFIKYCCTEEELKKLKGIYFPEKNEIECSLALISKDFPEKDEIKCSLALISKECPSEKPKNEFQSAWTNFVYELGIFNLDERMDIAKKFDKTPIFNSNNSQSFMSVEIDDIKDIWENLCKYKVNIILIDDDEYHFKNIGYEKTSHETDVVTDVDNEKYTIQNINDKEKGEEKDKEGDVCWIKPKEGFEINEIFSIKQIKEDHLLIFVIDLLYVEGGGSKIKGDEYIAEIRKKYNENAIIMGYTGGSSPFIYDSAVKSGADIVLYKSRGNNKHQTETGHSQSYDSQGLFDLLWALYKNTVLWTYMEKNLDSKDNTNDDIIEKLFGSVSNLTPFWKSYLARWNNKRLKEKYKKYKKSIKNEC